MNPTQLISNVKLLEQKSKTSPEISQEYFQLKENGPASNFYLRQNHDKFEEFRNMQNVERNRYSDVPCLDKTRVKITIRKKEEDLAEEKLSLEEGGKSEDGGFTEANSKRLLMNLPQNHSQSEGEEKKTTFGSIVSDGSREVGLINTAPSLNNLSTTINHPANTDQQTKIPINKNLTREQNNSTSSQNNNSNNTNNNSIIPKQSAKSSKSSANYLTSGIQAGLQAMGSFWDKTLGSGFSTCKTNDPNTKILNYGHRNRINSLQNNNNNQNQIYEYEPNFLATGYIHANYIKGINSQKLFDKSCYIGAQGPLQETSGHFWEMIVQSKVSSIVMTTRKIEKGRQKCHDYWPAKKGEIKVFQGSFLDNRNDQITVEFVDDQIKNNKAFSISLLKVTRKLKHVSSESNKNNCSFYLNHCWYTAWPDHGIPESSKEMIDFVFQVRKFDREVIGVWGCSRIFVCWSVFLF